jgi:RNA polymerase sigma factor (TIGR02999 family)
MTSSDTLQLLAAHRDGDLAAFDRLVERLYGELRQIAGHRLRGARAERSPSETASPTGLLHETYLRMRGESPPDWQNRGHFLAVAARAMRRVLVDATRAALAHKRGAALNAGPLGSGDLERLAAGGGETSLAFLLDLERGLEALSALDPRLCQVAELRLLAGLEMGEIATALGTSRRTVERDWQRGRAWLRREMTG